MRNICLVVLGFALVACASEPAEPIACSCVEADIVAWAAETGEIVDSSTQDVESVIAIPADTDEMEALLRVIEDKQKLREVALERISPPECLQEIHNMFVTVIITYGAAFEYASQDKWEDARTQVFIGNSVAKQILIETNKFDSSQVDC